MRSLFRRFGQTPPNIVGDDTPKFKQCRITPPSCHNGKLAGVVRIMLIMLVLIEYNGTIQGLTPLMTKNEARLIQWRQEPTQKKRGVIEKPDEYEINPSIK
ncbi:MAG TPA: hypothetical protein VLH61_04455 [Bacteroidales bacterium]|nr:hypothetical protein [Bacteroidales bacterium]